MDNSISEDDPPLPEPADEELPDMVPVSIRTPLEYQHCSLEKVLAGVLLTWEEFLQLFDIRPDPSEYFIRGNNGAKHNLGEKIGDYVSSFKRKLKAYPVTLERVNGINDNDAKSQKLSIKSEKSRQFPNLSEVEPDERDMKKVPIVKKRKLMDEDKRKKNNRKSHKFLAEIAQSMRHSQSVDPTATTTPPENLLGKKDGRSSTSSNEPSLANESSGYVSQSAQLNVQTAGTSASSRAKLKRLGSTESRKSKDNALTAPRRRGRKPKQKPQLVDESRRSSRTSKNTKDSVSDDETSESEVEEVPSKDNKKLLKDQAINYLTNKVSPRSFMRLRNELMALRDQEKYFKVTSVVPMTAGMMEQTFCRKINH